MLSINVGEYKITVEDPLVKKLRTLVDSYGVAVIAQENEEDSLGDWYVMQITAEGHIRGFGACPYGYLVEEIDA